MTIISKADISTISKGLCFNKSGHLHLNQWENVIWLRTHAALALALFKSATMSDINVNIHACYTEVAVYTQ